VGQPFHDILGYPATRAHEGLVDWTTHVPAVGPMFYTATFDTREQAEASLMKAVEQGYSRHVLKVKWLRD
jgi:hypothetical protein